MKLYTCKYLLKLHSIITVYLQLCEKQEIETGITTDGYWWLSDG